MAIAVTGLNHQRAPVEVRERLAFGGADLELAVRELAREAPEVVLLSTCNRTELYLADPDGAPDPGRARQTLCALKGIDPTPLADRFYTLTDQAAVEHLFRVASGLDAMVVGETQIIGQVRDAYEAGRTGRLFNTLFQRALHVAGRIHSETAIGRGGVSVPSVAARLADRLFEAPADRRLMVVGAGEMGLLTAAAFSHRGLKDLRMANRTEERARQAAAQHGGRAIPFESVAGTLAEVDIVVCCVESDRFVVSAPDVANAISVRGGEPILLIDLGVPRNIDPEAARIENVYLFDIDDLQSIVGQTILERQAEIDHSMKIILQESDQFMTTINNLWIEQIMKDLRDHMHRIGQEEVLKIKDETVRAAAEDSIRRIINRILHNPTGELKRNFEPGSPAEIIRRLFKLK